jgi:hypothetical protein
MVVRALTTSGQVYEFAMLTKCSQAPVPGIHPTPLTWTYLARSAGFEPATF